LSGVGKRWLLPHEGNHPPRGVLLRTIAQGAFALCTGEIVVRQTCVVLKPGTREAAQSDALTFSCGHSIQVVFVQGHRAILLLKENAGAFFADTSVVVQLDRHVRCSDMAYGETPS
jgi:hypothetical protein